MGVQIGLVGERADLVVEVASVAARAGAVVVPVAVSSTSWRAGRPPGGEDRGSLGDAVAGWADHVDVLLVDVAVLAGSQARPGPDSDPVGRQPDVPTAVICRRGEDDRARAAADLIGCPHVLEMPTGGPWLVEALSPPSESGLLGVLGATGGVGATTAAIACAVGAGRDCLLVDADPDSAGLDLPLGIPHTEGARWRQIPDSAAPLDPGSLRASLPQVEGVLIATGPDGAGLVPGSEAGSRERRVGGVLGAGRAEFRRTVADLGRGSRAAGLLGAGDAVALVVPATVAGVVGGRRALGLLPTDRVVVLVRPCGWLTPADVVDRLGVTSAIEVPHLRRAPELAECGDLLSGRTGRALRGLGERVWEAIR